MNTNPGLYNQYNSEDPGENVFKWSFYTPLLTVDRNLNVRLRRRQFLLFLFRERPSQFPLDLMVAVTGDLNSGEGKQEE